MTTIGTWWMWLVFAIFVVTATVIDLKLVKQQGAHRVSFHEALKWTLIWVVLAMVFNALLWWYLNRYAGPEIANQKATEFFTGYLIEKSLAVDNIFVFLMIFNFFAVPCEFQKRALILGVVGAISLRVMMILLGAWLIAHFHWLLYIFGAFLLFTGIKMIIFADHKPDLNKNVLLKWLRNHLNITHEYHGEKFIVYKDRIRFFTPLFLVLIAIAVTDVIFAVDSIPAIFAITEDPFIVMTSNIFAILGLRAMYFMLAEVSDRFHLLSYGLAIILIFVGTKMLIVEWFKVPVGWSLLTIVTILIATMLLSLWTSKAERKT